MVPKAKWLAPFLFSLVLFVFTSTVSAAGIIDVNTSDEASKLDEEFHTSPYTGAAVHAYTFVVPPGTNGLQPTVSVSYSSHSSNGFENLSGSGWNLNTSFIERDDNYTPSSTGDDIFYLNIEGDKQKLVYDSSAGFYKTLTDSFSRIQQATGSANNAQGNYWVVTKPNGTQLRFGYEAVSEEVCSDRNYVRRWYLDKVTDTNGNSIFYTYQETDNFSYLSKIEYNNEKKRVIDFVYEATNEDRVGTLNGCRVQLTQRLESVRITVNQSLYKVYELDYATTDTSHQLLTSITEKDATTNTLPATTFTYHDEIREWSDSPQTWYSSSSNPDISLNYKQTKLADVNRDNFPDIVWSHIDGNNRIIEVYKSTGSSWSTTSETWYSSSTYPEVDLTRDDVRLIDVNGDSLPDIVWSKVQSGDEREWYVLPNTGSAWSTTAQTWFDSSVDGLLRLDETTVQMADVNGDGKADIIRSEEYQDNGTKHRLKVYPNTGSGWSTTAQTWLETSLAVSLAHEPPEFIDTDEDEIPDTVNYFTSRTRIIDVTNDGLADIVYTEPYNNDANRRWHVFINKGDSWDSSSQNWMEASDAMDLSGRKLVMIDANGDGYTDIVKGEKYNGPWSRWEVWLNQGNNWNSTAVEFLDSDADPELGIDQTNVAIGDMNGDGYVDLVTTVGSGNLRTWKVTINNGYAGNRLKQTKNSTGGTTSLSYTPSSASDNTGEDSLSDLPFSIWLVSQSTQNNGMTGTHQRISTISYSYKDGSYDFDDREVRGFNQVTSTDSILKTIHLFHQDDGRKGREYKTSQKALNDTLYKEVETTWSNTQTNGIYKVLPSSAVTSLYDGTGTAFATTVNYTYDSYGNPTVIEQLGDSGNADDDRVAKTDYVYNTTNWLVSYPKKIWNEDAADNKVSETLIYYDGNASIDTAPTEGNVTKEEKWHDKGENIITTYTYDAYGNKITVTDPNSNTTTITFGTTDTTYTYPDSQTNELDQTIIYSYDLATGNLLSITDDNGYVTSYSYDTFGRLVKEVRPYDTTNDPTVSYTYTFDGTAPEILKTTQMMESSVSATLEKYEITDGYGQVVQVKQEAENVSNQIIKDIFYDSRGNNTGQSNQYEASASAGYTTPDTNKPRTTITYDLLRRPTAFENPDDTTKTTSYSKDHITYTDENSNDIDHYLNRFGEIIRVEEHTGTDTYKTTYSYDSRGNLKTITDEKNNVILYTYDSLGRKIGLTDPDMGTWLYNYDKNGNLAAYTDNRGITITAQFDELNRMDLKDFPTDPDITYTYDNPVVGTLSSASTSQYSKSFSYDQRLRQTQESLTMDTFTWTTSRVYNSADQVIGITYPDGQHSAVAINNQGLVESIDPVITNINYTPSGKVAQKAYNNGLTTNYTYDSETTRLTRMQTSTLQDLNYAYDNAGNITSYEDPTTGTDKTFTYDDLNRLITAVDPMENDITHRYDPLGNLVSFTFNDNTYQFEYGHTGGPHSLSSGNFLTPLGFELPAFSKPLTSHSYGYYFSFVASTTLGGISVTTSDIMRYNDQTSTWSMYFDGSDVGISQAIDAIELLPDGSILMSFAGTVTLDWGSVPKQDIVRFIPTSTGDTTEGVFELYFDGSNVGVSSSTESTKVIATTSNGNLLLQEADGYDMSRFVPTGLRHITAGTFSDYLDGYNTDALTSDLLSTYYDYATNTLYLTDNDDTNIHKCTMQIEGTFSECTGNTVINTSSWGITKKINGFHYYNPPTVNIVPNDPDLIEGMYLSHDESYTEVDGLTLESEDIAYYDLATDTWAFYIDGSDISLNEIQSFHVMNDGSVLMSFGGNQTVSGLGTVTGQDIVRFIPTSTGTTTAGSFEWYFDGSDIGISSTDYITGISIAPDGKLLITLDDRQEGNPAWGDVNVAYKFNHTSLGSNTAGTLVRYFEGEDVNLFYGYVAMDSGPSGNLYLIPDTHASLKHVTAEAEHDILRCQPSSLGAHTACQFGILMAATKARYDARIDGMSIKFAENPN